MSTFCNLEEAFLGPIVVPGPSKKKKRRDGGGGVGIEHFVAPPLSSTPDVTAEQGEEHESNAPMQGPPPATKKLQAGGSSELDSFFPLPGETAEPEEWQKAFILQPSQIPQPLQQQLQRRPPMLTNGAVAVNGQPTLWRQIPEPVPINQPVAAAPVPSEINKRLDALTRQLESLTTPTPLQSTAELFLFVAIGLMILLAIDSLLRFASGSMQGGRVGGGRVGGGRVGWRGRSRW